MSISGKLYPPFAFINLESIFFNCAISVLYSFLYSFVLLSHFIDLLDDINYQVDKTDQKLIRTEAKVQKVTKKAGTCCEFNNITIQCSISFSLLYFIFRSFFC